MSWSELSVQELKGRILLEAPGCEITAQAAAFLEQSMINGRLLFRLKKSDWNELKEEGLKFRCRKVLEQIVKKYRKSKKRPPKPTPISKPKLDEPAPGGGMRPKPESPVSSTSAPKRERGTSSPPDERSMTSTASFTSTVDLISVSLPPRKLLKEEKTPRRGSLPQYSPLSASSGEVSEGPVTKEEPRRLRDGTVVKIELTAKEAASYLTQDTAQRASYLDPSALEEAHQPEPEQDLAPPERPMLESPERPQDRPMLESPARQQDSPMTESSALEEPKVVFKPLQRRAHPMLESPALDRPLQRRAHPTGEPKVIFKRLPVDCLPSLAPAPKAKVFWVCLRDRGLRRDLEKYRSQGSVSELQVSTRDGQNYAILGFTARSNVMHFISNNPLARCLNWRENDFAVAVFDAQYINTKDVEAEFKKYGPIEDCTTALKRERAGSRLLFVKFRTLDGMVKCLAQCTMAKVAVSGVKARVDHYSYDEVKRNRRILIPDATGLSTTGIIKAFSKWGVTREVQMRTNRMTPIAFVEFANYRDAHSALKDQICVVDDRFVQFTLTKYEQAVNKRKRRSHSRGGFRPARPPSRPRGRSRTRRSNGSKKLRSRSRSRTRRSNGSKKR